MTPILPTVVAVCGDAGGANAVAPVLEVLRDEGRVQVNAFAYRQARTLWRQRDLEFESLPEEYVAGSSDGAEAIRHSRLLLTGTSANSVDWEKKFIVAARETGVPSLAVFDFWSNYALRFSECGQTLNCLPNCIAVMDDLAYHGMISEGIDAQSVEITGHPAFDSLARVRECFGPPQRARERARQHVPESSRMIAFVSQPWSELYPEGAAHPLSPGYSEVAVLEMLLCTLKTVAERHRQHLAIVVRPHPRETAKPLPELSSPWVSVRLAAKGSAHELVMASDLVVGMTSILLVEACYLGCLTVSLQPGLRKEDVLPTNATGLSRAVYCKEELLECVESLLLDTKVQARMRSVLAAQPSLGGAAQRVAQLAYRLAGV